MTTPDASPAQPPFQPPVQAPIQPPVQQPVQQPAQYAYQAPVYTAEAARPRLSGLSLASFILGAFFLLGLMLFRILNVVITYRDTHPGSLVTVLGVFGLLTIVLVAIEVLLGHLGLVATRPGRKRGRALAIIGLAIGYALVVFYLTTVVTAAIATGQPHQDYTFVQNFFNWV